MLTITQKALERIESQELPLISDKASSRKARLFAMKVFGFSFLGALMAVFFYSDMSLTVGGAIFAFLSPGLIVFLACWMASPIEVKPTEVPSKDIKQAIIDRLRDFYLSDGNVALLKSLYDKSLLEKDQKEQIEQFLVEKNKTIVDYLMALGDKNLATMAEPYREQINKDINEAVNNYFITRKTQLQLEIEAENNKKSDREKFQEDSLKFFYSTMPKNIAIR